MKFDMKKVVGGTVLVVAGGVGMHMADSASIPSEERVRAALYTACVNSDAYAPKAAPAPGFQCNRESIDLALAVMYQQSHIPPIDGTEPAFEAEILKYKKKPA